MKEGIEGLIVGLIIGVCLTIIILGTYEQMQKTVIVSGVLESFDNQNFTINSITYRCTYLPNSTMNHYLGKQVEIKLMRNEFETFTLRATKGL